MEVPKEQARGEASQVAKQSAGNMFAKKHKCYDFLVYGMDLLDGQCH